MRSENFLETADIETSSDDYAQRFSGEIGVWLLRVQEAAILRLLPPYAGGTILDVGGGHGQLTPALVQHGYQVTVLGSAATCQRRIQGLVDTQRCLFKVGDILALPYPSQAFDVVVSYRFLPHVSRWQQFVTELTRVARLAVLVDYPALYSVNYIAPLLFHLKKRLEGNTRPYTSFKEADFKEAEVVEVFRSCGFRRAARYPEFFLPLVLHRLLQLPKLSSVLEGVCRLAGLTSCFGSPVILQLIRERR